MKEKKLISLFLALAMLAGLFNPALPFITANAEEPAMPNVITAAVAGSFQTELGAESDWDPDSHVTEMTFYDNGVLEYIAVLPAGDYEYKIALNDDWGEAYPGENVSLSVPENNTRVIFRYDSFTHQVADSINNPSEFPAVALVGTIITDTTTPDPIDWNPSNENTELEYMGGGIYKFSAFVLAGEYEYKVALNDSWAVSYPGSNKPLSVAEDQTVDFYYNHNTHSVKDTINDTITTVAVVGTIQSALGGSGDWNPADDIAEMHDVDEDGIYMFQGFLPQGNYEYKIALNDAWGGDYPGSNVVLAVPEGGCTVLFLADNINKMVKDSINDAPTAVQRYIEFKYFREDGDYEGWNIWVWGTGKKDDQIDFTEYRDGYAIAKIQISNTNERVGFKLRKGSGWDTVDQDFDRYIETAGLVVTKATIYSGQPDFFVVPKVTAPVNNEGDVTFFYRDEELYRQNLMHTLAEGENGVKLKFNGSEYLMQYNSQNEYFEYTVEDVDYGIYEYSYIITKDGVTTEIPDPMNTVDGVSKIVYIRPTATINSTVEPSSITYNENAVLSLDIELSEGTVSEIYADLTELGGNTETYIDPQLNALSISVVDSISPGTKNIPVTVIDEYGNSHTHTASVEVLQREPSGELDFDWDEARIYFLLTDRFNDGDPTNNDPNGENYGERDPGEYYGGDFQGIIDKLDYLDELGINTIWISPIVDNINFGLDTPTEEDIKYYAYHGYWAKNFEVIEEHFGDLETFKELIDAAHDRGIKIMVDVVLNHTGYGLKESDAGSGSGITNYPTAEDRARFAGMLRTVNESGDIRSELAGLPDFKTEEEAVRAQIIAWQTDWLEKARTERGDTIDYFRVDTVKHVDDTTWKAFKNRLTELDPDFKLIGEWFGAGPGNTGGQLKTGQMDSLLDFEFKAKAKDFVDGRIDEANAYFRNRDKMINNTATFGQFLSSHDENGFLISSLGGDTGKMKVASALQITSKGQPVIYYGEELGLSGMNNYPYYDNRPAMPWEDIETNESMQDMLNHYKKLLNIRASYSKVFSKGTSVKVAGGDSEGYLVVRRSYENKDIYVALNTKAEEAEVTINVMVPNSSVYLDEYSGATYTVSENKVRFTIPGRNEGGTAILTTEAKSSGIPPVPDNHIRIHYNRPDGNYDTFGVWTWGDVASPSTGWPTGAAPFDSAQTDSYGAYIDIELAEGARQIGFLIVDRSLGDAGKDGGDKSFTIASPEMNEIWVRQGSDEVFKYEPVDLPPDTVRVHYVRENDDYEPLGLWIWEDVREPSSNWPTGAIPFSSERTDRYGAYIDVSLTEGAKKIGFLVVNRSNGEKDGGDKSFNLLDRFNHIWIKEGDDTVYISPYWEIATGLLNAEVISQNKILLGFTMTEGLEANELKNALVITDCNSNTLTVTEVEITGPTTAEITVSEDLADVLPLQVTYAGRTVTANSGWRLIDNLYSYDGADLGATYMNSSAMLKLWAPTATEVVADFYDKDDPTVLIGSLNLTKGDNGVWSVLASPENFTGVEDLRGYFYQYNVTNNGVTKKVLDPYAKSMAVFRVSTDGQEGPDGDSVGKAAIVDLSQTNPENFSFANIEGYEKREDAIIWEVHIRDFTSDPSIEGDLNSRWGSYKAFIDKLDYIKSLGVTHIQLLPVMAWYYGDESQMGHRELEYSVKDNNYNWGYDPHSYFSPDGAYSEDPADPELRVRELKELIKAIHDAGMGVILDVVYTHMAKTSLLNDIVPDYYAFKDANGNFLGGFGNNLATNHKMAEKLMIDSVKYWFSEYKLDGMRFDMMGDATCDSIQKAYDAAAEINPKALFIGEGWRTFSGHLSDPSLAGKGADQDWMDETDDVGVFSDEIRNELKSGFGHEGQPRFITGGDRNIQTIFNNIKGQPGNVTEDDPGDIVQYIEAHDNLTLHDVIALSIKKDPLVPANELEIHKRIRLGNALILTSQGTAFLHAGQEYGRTKQWLGEGVPERSYTELKDAGGNTLGYFINDSYDSSDAINMFDWSKATNQESHPVNYLTRKYTEGLIALRKSTNAFRLGTKALVDSNVKLINAPEINANDLVIGYSCQSTDGTGTYYVFVNADNARRTLTLQENLTSGIVLVDNDEAGVTEVSERSGFELTANSIALDPLTAVVIRIPQGSSSTPSAPPQSSVSTETSVSGDTVTTTKTISAAGSAGGVSKAEISQNHIIDAINAVTAEASKHGEGTETQIEIKVETTGNVNTIETNFPKGAIDLLAEREIDSLKLNTPLAAITFDSDTLASIAGEAEEDITVNVSLVDNSTLPSQAREVVGDRPVYNFSITSGDKNISQFGGNVSVTLPYTLKEGEDPDSIVIYYIKADGELEIVSNCVYDPVTGTVTFITDHFSHYAVGYNKVTFKDIAANEFRNAIEFIAARGITVGTGNNNFSPDNAITRGELLVMAMKAYGIKPDTEPKDNFADAGNSGFTGYLAAAKRLGLASGVGGNRFAPDQAITRQEMFTILHRILKHVNQLPKDSGGKSLPDFSDVNKVAVWAHDAMTLFAKAGIIRKEDTELNPDGRMTRAQTAGLLYNLLAR